MSKKQPLRIFYTDFWPGFEPEHHFIHHILQEKYDIIIDPQQPDYVIFSCFGERHRRYDAIKIHVNGENFHTDFNSADYAIGPDYLEFGDRYFRHPLWRNCLGSISEHHLSSSLPPHFWQEKVRAKQKFCNFIYSNSSHAAPERAAFFNRLSRTYKWIDSGGRYLNNIGGVVADKLAWQRGYKFSIAFENSSQPGYLTEKIIDALKADTIPIYWGDPCVAQEINPKRFINVHDFENFDAVIAAIKRLDEDEESYIAMLSQPWFIGNPPPSPLQDETLKAWIWHIFDQDIEKARRVICFGWRKIALEKQRRDEKKNLLKHLQPFIRAIERPFRKMRSQYYRFFK